MIKALYEPYLTTAIFDREGVSSLSMWTHCARARVFRKGIYIYISALYFVRFEKKNLHYTYTTINEKGVVLGLRVYIVRTSVSI